MPAQAPLPLALIVCDQVSIDRDTGKTAILGAFENVFAASFPAMHPELTVYSEFTDGHGRVAVTVRIVRSLPDSLEGQELASQTTDMEFPDPFKVVRWVVKVRGLSFPEPGEYRFIVECGGTIVIERRVLALIQEQHHDTGDPS